MAADKCYSILMGVLKFTSVIPEHADSWKSLLGVKKQKKKTHKKKQISLNYKLTFSCCQVDIATKCFVVPDVLYAWLLLYKVCLGRNKLWILKKSIYGPLMLREGNLEGMHVYDPYLRSSWHIRWETFLGSNSEVLSPTIKRCFSPYQIGFITWARLAGKD